jgi:hypothetical protein
MGVPFIAFEWVSEYRILARHLHPVSCILGGCMDWFLNLGAEITKVGTVVAVMAVLGKLAVGTLLKSDLETHKARLKGDNDAAIQAAKHAFDESLALYKKKLDVTAKSDERIRAEIIAWANPIRDASESLKRRLHNILDNQGHVALTPGYANPEWSISYEYFQTSTLYLFGRYFSWIHMLRQELSFELFRSQQDREAFFKSIDRVSDAIANYDGPTYQGTGRDVQVFRLEQQAVGEYLALRVRGRRACCSYAWFTAHTGDPDLQRLLKPLVNLVDRLQPGEKRWGRLQAVHTAMEQLVQECDRVLKLSSVAS